MKLVFIPLLALIVVGCGASSNDDSSTQAADPTPAVADATATPTATVRPTRTPRPTRTATPRPTATPTAIPPKLELGDYGFVSYTNSLGDLIAGWWVDVTSEATGTTVADVSLQAVFYDTGGTILGTDSIRVGALFAGQTLRAIDSHASLPGPVSRMEVRIDRERYVEGQTSLVMTAEEIEYVPDRFSPSVRGIIVSPYSTDLRYVELGCLARDINGTVIAVGTGTIDLLPGGSRAIGECRLDSRSELGGLYSVELHASVGFLTSIVE